MVDGNRQAEIEQRPDGTQIAGFGMNEEMPAERPDAFRQAPQCGGAGQAAEPWDQVEADTPDAEGVQRFAALAGDCPAQATRPGSVAIKLPALGFAICAAGTDK